MQNDSLKNIKPFTVLDLKSAYILIQHTDQIPPHIGIISEGKYFSSSVTGVKLGIEAEIILKNVTTKHIPTLVVEIDTLRFSTEAVGQIFDNYGPLDTPEKSCLFPIIELLSKSYGLVLESQFVFELIRELESDKKIRAFYELNMDHLIVSSSYSLPFYTRDEIRFCIQSLQNKVTI